MNEQTVQLNTHSSRITQPKSQGASQAMLLATGLSQSNLDKPQIGIAACWFEGNLCNMHLDGRFSGGSHGFIVGHVVPEAQEGGPIALVRDGDVITIDDETHEMAIIDSELAARADEWTAPHFKATSGTLWKYIRLVEDASNGCVADG